MIDFPLLFFRGNRLYYWTNSFFSVDLFSVDLKVQAEERVESLVRLAEGRKSKAGLRGGGVRLWL